MKTRLILIAGIFFAVLSVFCAAGCAKEKTAAVSHQQTFYQCSMHPAITSDKPGDCPICGMRLTRVDHTEEQAAPEKQEGGLPGRAVITIDPRRQQQIGVKSFETAKVPLEMKVRSLGRVAYDPDLYNTIGEYREALSVYLKARVNANMAVRERAESVMKLAELKLRLAGISSDQMAGLKSAGRNTERLIMLTESARNLVLPPGKVWVYTDLYEHESGLAVLGQTAAISSSALPGKFFKGEVKTVDLVPNAPVRTLRVRLETEDSENLLRAGMSVDVVLRVDLGKPLAVPSDAVLNTGESTLVFVIKEESRFEPREVVIGHEASGFIEIISGLSEGEKVVSSANFLIDSESRIRSALQNFGASENSKSSSESSSAGGHSHG